MMFKLLLLVILLCGIHHCYCCAVVTKINGAVRLTGACIREYYADQIGLFGSIASKELHVSRDNNRVLPSIWRSMTYGCYFKWSVYGTGYIIWIIKDGNKVRKE